MSRFDEVALYTFTMFVFCVGVIQVAIWALKFAIAGIKHFNGGPSNDDRT